MGGELCSSVSNFLKILNLLDKIVSTILSRIVGTLREIEKLKKNEQGLVHSKGWWFEVTLV